MQKLQNNYSPAEPEDAVSTPGQAEQTQFLYDIRCVDHGPLGLIDHLNLLPGGSTLRPV